MCVCVCVCVCVYLFGKRVRFRITSRETSIMDKCTIYRFGNTFQH